MKEAIIKLLQDEAFQAKLEQVESVEEMVALFAANGINATEAEINAVIDSMEMQGELGEDALDEVAGGAFSLKKVSCPVCKKTMNLAAMMVHMITAHRTPYRPGLGGPKMPRW